MVSRNRSKTDEKNAVERLEQLMIEDHKPQGVSRTSPARNNGMSRKNVQRSSKKTESPATAHASLPEQAARSPYTLEATLFKRPATDARENVLLDHYLGNVHTVPKQQRQSANDETVESVYPGHLSLDSTLQLLQEIRAHVLDIYNDIGELNSATRQQQDALPGRRDKGAAARWTTPATTPLRQQAAHLVDTSYTPHDVLGHQTFISVNAHDGHQGVPQVNQPELYAGPRSKKGYRVPTFREPNTGTKEPLLLKVRGQPPVEVEKALPLGVRGSVPMGARGPTLRGYEGLPPSRERGLRPLGVRKVLSVEAKEPSFLLRPENPPPLRAKKLPLLIAKKSPQLEVKRPPLLEVKKTLPLGVEKSPPLQAKNIQPLGAKGPLPLEVKRLPFLGAKGSPPLQIKKPPASSGKGPHVQQRAARIQAPFAETRGPTPTDYCTAGRLEEWDLTHFASAADAVKQWGSHNAQTLPRFRTMPSSPDQKFPFSKRLVVQQPPAFPRAVRSVMRGGASVKEVQPYGVSPQARPAAVPQANSHVSQVFRPPASSQPKAFVPPPKQMPFALRGYIPKQQSYFLTNNRKTAPT